MATSNLRALTFTVANTPGSSEGKAISSANISAKMVLNKSSLDDPDYEFVFPFAPISVEYSNLAAEWTEIQRPGRTPIVEYSSNKLLQVSFKFLVAKPFDGISQSIDGDLVTLRYMASSQRTVSIFGMDGMLTKPFQIAGQPNRASTGFFFNITEFSISSLRRNTSNEIAAADCSITLTEVNNPQITVAQFPAITYPVAVPPPAKKTTTKSSDPWKMATSQQRIAREKLAAAGIYIATPAQLPKNI